MLEGLDQQRCPSRCLVSSARRRSLVIQSETALDSNPTKTAIADTTIGLLKSDPSRSLRASSRSSREPSPPATSRVRSRRSPRALPLPSPCACGAAARLAGLPPVTAVCENPHISAALRDGKVGLTASMAATSVTLERWRNPLSLQDVGDDALLACHRHRLLLSRRHRKAEALDARVPARGLAIRTTTRYGRSFRARSSGIARTIPEHARPQTRNLFKEVHDHSAVLSQHIQSGASHLASDSSREPAQEPRLADGTSWRRATRSCRRT